MPLHFIVSVLPVAIFLGWYNLFMFSLDFFIFSFEYQTPMLYLSKRTRSVKAWMVKAAGLTIS